MPQVHTIKEYYNVIHSPAISAGAGLLDDMGDCMMSENDPGMLVPPPSTTLPNTDLQKCMVHTYIEFI